VKHGFASFFRDNLEAFAVAIAMALVIRHFCIEAFRIPTKSMTPTLLGDDPTLRLHGDRILVDKFVYLRRDPARWEVIVFQYPLNRNRNFIKRLGGLPGEWLRIVDGDLWVSTDEGESYAIQRKPAGVREQLFFPYYPEPAGWLDAFAAGGCWKADAGWRVDEANARFDVDASSESTLRFARKIKPFPAVDTEGNAGRPYAGDVRVRFDVAVERAGTLTVQLMEHGRPHRLVLGPDESYATITTTKKEHRFPLPVRVEDGQEFSVSFANVDNTLLIDIDGDLDVSEEIEFPDATSQPEDPSIFESGHDVHRIELQAEQLKATLADVRIDRDVCYSASRTDNDPLAVWKIPEGHYFALGDNTDHSKDSRKWTVAEANFGNGDVIRWEPAHDSDVPGQPYAIIPDDDDEMVDLPADVDGFVRRFRAGDVTDFRARIDYPFVSRDHLIGRAFAIFWPIHLWPVYKGPSRVNVIR